MPWKTTQFYLHNVIDTTKKWMQKWLLHVNHCFSDQRNQYGVYIYSIITGPMIPLNSFINYSSQLVFVQDKWILLHSMSYWLLVHVQGIPLELFFYLVDLANWTNRIHHNFFICFKTYTSIMYVFKKKKHVQWYFNVH